MTKAAENFITPLTLSSLSREKVYTSMFNDSMDGNMIHIELASKADALLIAPATADIIGKLANGLADDLLTSIALGTKAPILLAPAMNTEMYQNKIVQDNCEKLKKYGMKFIDPVMGKLACGVVGEGHIADQQTIIKAVLQSLK
jgi:phosphopantothenoylcysteine decarboxylase/phosphopantothenate--cysteine ligase